MQEYEAIIKYLDDELTPIKIHIEELEEQIETFSSSLTEVKKLVVSLIGGRNV